MKPLKYLCLAILLVALIVRCSTSTSIRTDYKTRDLDPKLVSEFRANSNYFYKFDPKYSVDYMVSLVRMNVFASKNTQNMGEILLSFGLIGRGKSFDCDEFFAKLTTEEKAGVLNPKWMVTLSFAARQTIRRRRHLRLFLSHSPRKL